MKATKNTTNLPGASQKNSRSKSIIRLVLLAFAATFLFLLLYSLTVISQAPKIDPTNIYKTLSESSILYDDDNHVMDKVYQQDGNRTNISYKDIPQDMIDAIVSTEDKTFWKHHGFNFIRMVGALKDALFSRSQIQGTSTITQQLARNVYLPDTKSQRSLNRKLCEAWYTVILERHLSKKEIIEAYLNTIYLGYNSYGIQSAAQAYFSKDASDMSLTQCAALASIPSSPSAYALVKTLDNKTSESNTLTLQKKDIIKRTSDYTLLYNGAASANRRNLILKNMKEQGYITDAEFQQGKKDTLRKEIDLSSADTYSEGIYMTDFVIEQVIKDLQAKGYDGETARHMIYAGGLKIHTTMNRQVQKSLNNAFNKDYHFPSTANINYDNNGNILNKNDNLLMYKISNIINRDSQLVIPSSHWKKTEEGNYILKAGNYLRFIKDTNKTILIKPMYTTEKGKIHSISDSTVLIPKEYKKFTESGNLQISRKFVKDFPGSLTEKNGSLVFPENGYALGPKVQHPQGAMVIIDYKTGAIKGIIGGRGTTGKLLYNRARSPRQPGSSIKPLSVYSTALEQGAAYGRRHKKMSFSKKDSNELPYLYGKYWTVSSQINDSPLHYHGRVWPRNWYNNYRGVMSLRKAVEQSVNTIAVRVMRQVGTEKSMKQLKDFGITTVKESGAVNDKTPAALALGGMTQGISPVEMASAYGTFPNKGVHKDYCCYTSVVDKNGDEVLKADTKEKKVMNEDVSFIMTDILRTTVTRGIAHDAATSNPTAGKTGTTSDNFDAWFCGFTPGYSAACWIGNDVNIELSEGSAAAARLWSSVMENLPSSGTDSFPSMPSTVSRIAGEYYATGTESEGFLRRIQIMKRRAADKAKKEKEKKQKEKNKKKNDKKRSYIHE